MAERDWMRGVVVGLFVLHTGIGGCTVDENKYKFGTASGDSSGSGGQNVSGNGNGQSGSSGSGGSGASSTGGSGGSGASTTTSGGGSGPGTGATDSGGTGNVAGDGGTDAGAGGSSTGGTDPGITCPMGQHVCADQCFPNDDVATCGTSCSPCEAPTDGTATCDGTKCGAECPTDKKLCLGACIAMNEACSGKCPDGTHACEGLCPSSQSVNACGTSCVPCEVPTGAEKATCDGTSCSFVCATGYHRCGNGCAADDDAKACGAACNACPTTANGAAVCLAGTCGITCKAGYHLCGTECVSDTSPLSCGSSCDPCEVPTGGVAKCTSGKCEGSCVGDQLLCLGSCLPSGSACKGSCPSGRHACNDLCVADTSTTACGTSCTQCTKPTGASTVSCTAGACDFACGSGYHRCGNACNTDDDANACGSACKKCATTANGVAICQANECAIRCDTNYHLCGGKCIANSSTAQCGPECVACTAPTGGTVTCNGSSCLPTCPGTQKICNGACVAANAACGMPCPSGTHNCSGFCVSSTELATCGTHCDACTAPPSNGSAICTSAGQCDISCATNYHKCDTACVRNDDVKTCGTNCTPCTAPTNAIPECGASGCTFKCKDGYTGSNCELLIFQPVPMPSGFTRMFLGDLSGNGTTVTGRVDNGGVPRSFRWVLTASSVTLFPATPGTFADTINTDGQYIGGTRGNSDGSIYTPVRWNSSLAATPLPSPSDTTVNYSVYGISGDGTTLVGYTPNGGLVWRVGDSTDQVITSANFQSVNFFGTTGDGKIAVGNGYTTGQIWVGTWWSSGGGVAQLSGGSGSGANAISKDGSVIVGGVNGTPVRWRGAGFVTRDSLPVLPSSGSSIRANVSATNQDGSVSVGSSETAEGFDEAAVWKGSTQVQKIADILTEAGSNLSGWVLVNGQSVSDDGKIVLGSGTFNGVDRAWIARLP